MPIQVMAPTYKKVMVASQTVYRCSYIECYHVADQIDLLKAHQKFVHGVFTCDDCSEFYFSETEKDNCLAFHESDKIAKAIQQRRHDKPQNDHQDQPQDQPQDQQEDQQEHQASEKTIIGPVKRIIYTFPKHLAHATARAQAQAVADRHLKVINSRTDDNYILLSPPQQEQQQQHQEQHIKCDHCDKSFRTLAGCKAHVRFSHRKRARKKTFRFNMFKP